MIRHTVILLCLFMLAPASHAIEPSVKNDYLVLYQTKGKFDNVKEAVELAITDRGLVINNVSHIGKMLARTGKDLGATKKVYIEAQALEFCSATVSRRTMEADPRNMIFCPYIVNVYVLPQEPETVYLAYRRPQRVGSKESKAALRAVEELLDGIVREALQW